MAPPMTQGIISLAALLDILATPVVCVAIRSPLSVEAAGTRVPAMTQVSETRAVYLGVVGFNLPLLFFQ